MGGSRGGVLGFIRGEFSYTVYSVFVLKWKSTLPPRGLDVHRIYPISSSFAITMAQTRRATSEVPPSIFETPEIQARSGKDRDCLVFKAISLITRLRIIVNDQSWARGPSAVNIVNARRANSENCSWGM
jgi:hypothetical protein